MADSGRIVAIAMDGSPNADHAFDSMVMTDIQIVSDQMDLEYQRIKTFLEELGERLTHAGIGGKVRSRSGSPGDVIVEIAEEEGACMIVTGSRGHGKLRRTFIGSISDYVLHHSSVPVVVIKQVH